MSTLERTGHVGVDLGGTKIAAAVVTDTGEIRGRRRQLHQVRGYQQTKQLIAALVAEQVAEATIDGIEIHGVGVAVPGLVDLAGEWVGTVANLGFGQVRLGPDLSRELGLPVSVGNDANAAALGEARFGRAVGGRCVAVLTLGTGVGGALLVDGALFLGSRGRAGEFGHLPVVRHGRRCGCGGNGCLETVASGPAVAQEWLRRTTTKNQVRRSATDLMRAVAAREPAALDVLFEAGVAVGRALTMVASAIDIDRCVIGGGFGIAAADQLLPAIRVGQLVRRPFAQDGDPAEVMVSTLGEDAATFGAVVAAREQHR